MRTAVAQPVATLASSAPLLQPDHEPPHSLMSSGGGLPYDGMTALAVYVRLGNIDSPESAADLVESRKLIF